MSLEAALQEHTEVMRELLARLTAGSLTAVQTTGAESVAEDKKAPSTAKDEKPKLNPAAAWPFPNAKPGSPAAALNAKQGENVKTETAEKPVEAIDYEKAVRPVLVKLSTSKGRDALVGLLARFNAAKGDQLEADDYGNVIAAANELLAA